MQIGIFGTFDVENYGDLLFPIIAELELKQRLGNFNLIRFSYNAKKESSWYYDVKSLAELQKEPAILQSLDCILIGGGHLIRFDKTVASNYGPPIPQIPHPTGYWLAPALAGVAAGKPVVWNAPSASEEIPRWAQNMFCSVLDKSAYVAVRDKPSLQSLQKTGYRGSGRIVPDTVFSLANHFPLANLQVRTDELLSSIGLKKKYIIVQATSKLDSLAREFLSDTDITSEYEILVLPIGPVIWDNVADITKFFPQAKWFPDWPSPVETAGLIANSSGVVGLSLHLSITALEYGRPVLRPKNTPINKYDLLKDSENVYFYDSKDLSVLASFKNAVRSGSQNLCSLAKETQPQLEEHWNTIAEICQSYRHHLSSRGNNYAKANFLLSRRERFGDAAPIGDQPPTHGMHQETLDSQFRQDVQSHRNSDTCIILHLYYPEMWTKIVSYLSNINSKFDLYITTPENVDIRDHEIYASFPNTKIYHCKNRGRDILPFLKIYSLVADLGYKYICKVHTKKSPQFDNGASWNWDMWNKLLGSQEIIANAKKAFDEIPQLGIIAPSDHLLPLMLGSHYWGGDQPIAEELALVCNIAVDDDVFVFSAGSMFWFRPETFKLILETGISDNDFEPELGQLDGTLAHALERFFGLLAVKEGYKIAESDSRGVKLANISFHFVRLLEDFRVLEQKILELNCHISTLTVKASKEQELLNEIYRSKAWKLVKMLRQVRIFLVPLGSTREEIARKVFQRFRSSSGGR